MLVLLKQITKQIATAEFQVFWEGVNNSLLHLNFNPIISQHNLSGIYCLLHWQAKPKYYRRWGIYYSLHDYYYPFNWEELSINEKIIAKALDISESKFKTVPTAVIYLQAKLTKTNGGITLNAV